MKNELLERLFTTSQENFRESNQGDRISRSELYLSVAKLVSFRSTCNRVSAGCIIVSGGRIVSMGYAGSPPGMNHCLEEGCEKDNGGCIRTQHAEANAISWAAREGIKLNEAILYSTLSPCLACAKLVVMSGVVQYIYTEEYRIINGLNYLKRAGVLTNHAKIG